MSNDRNETNPDVEETEAGEVTEAQEAGPSAENQMLLQMISDPEIQAVLAARREGRPIEITEPKPEDTDPEAEAALLAEMEDFEDEDVKKLGQILDKRLDLKLGALLDKVSALETLAGTFQKQAVDGQIKAISDKHSDFEKYRPAMAKLARAEGSGLSVEELYMLAKLRAGELPLTEPSTHSERPTPTPRRRTVAAEATREGHRRGRRGFQVTLADALDRLEDRHR